MCITNNNTKHKKMEKLLAPSGIKIIKGTSMEEMRFIFLKSVNGRFIFNGIDSGQIGYNEKSAYKTFYLSELEGKEFIITYDKVGLKKYKTVKGFLKELNRHLPNIIQL